MICYTNTKELTNKKYVGIATGFVNISPFFGTATINTVVAWFIQSTAPYNYHSGVHVYFIVSIIAFITSFFLKEGK